MLAGRKTCCNIRVAGVVPSVVSFCSNIDISVRGGTGVCESILKGNGVGCMNWMSNFLTQD